MEKLAIKVSSWFANTTVIVCFAIFCMVYTVLWFFDLVPEKLTTFLLLEISFVTMLIGMLIQTTQTKDTTAIQAKQDVIIDALEDAPNDFIRVEDKPLKEIQEMRQRTQGGT